MFASISWILDWWPLGLVAFLVVQVLKRLDTHTDEEGLDFIANFVFVVVNVLLSIALFKTAIAAVTTEIIVFTGIQIIDRIPVDDENNTAVTKLIFLIIYGVTLGVIRYHYIWA